ncbi:toll/interleukin-1 receptor domain-containing protein [Actinoplanes aureus]|uniref:Toll/interleukin-1 receptor domain-containing protein n=1 Tax=Actinoplanes aureus TaxID=2792083 RepID=A0A931CEE9_9ACTN|nr:toll/interleukin-1 receptor domain-containing protein [Actinoplanes aureus]MBG0565761.1 toll/interleukin-1 receptor domain-containing protein [Actinoplanes aureus]
MPIFVSHAAPDEPWAQWIALELRAAGHDVHLESAGSDFAQRIAVALSGTDPVLVLLSAVHRGTDDDWRHVAGTPAPPGRLITLCLDTAEPPGPLRALPCRSLHSLDEEDALDLLMSLVGGPRRNPNEWTTGRSGLDPA